MSRLYPLLAVFALAGCTTGREPEIRTVEVKTPVAVSCVPKNLGPEPVYPDTDKAIRDTAGADEMLKLLAAGRLLRVQRAKETEPVIAGCR